MKLTPARRIRGQLHLPGDKSISHRVALIAGLAPGVSKISNFSSGRDCASTLACLEQLGVRVENAAEFLAIEGRENLVPASAPLDCGNSGSTMRILAGVLAGFPFTSQLIGDESLTSRPMTRIIEPLELMGAKISTTDGKAPLTVTGTEKPQAITYQLPVASAQVKSAILFAALRAIGQTTVIESSPTRDHTERLFNGFGVSVKSENSSVSLNGPATFTAGDMTIPGDISSAAYFVAAATLIPGSDLLISDVGLNPTRSAFLPVLSSWGANIRTDSSALERNEPIGSIKVRGGIEPGAHEQARRLGRELIPSLIDELPLLAVVGTQVSGGIEIRDAAELRHKESDRLATTAHNLRAMGALVQEHEDGLTVTGPTKLKGASLNSFGDHRIAMAFSVAALIAHGPSEIVDADCVKISFPEFFQLLKKVAEF